MTSHARKREIGRRTALQAVGVGALALTGALGGPVQAQAIRPGAHRALLERLVGGRAARQGKVTVRLPEIAENGNTVPVTVSVDSPMTLQNYVRTIHVVADDNPNPEVFSARLTPASGRAEISTRIRLARTQTVIAYAELSDGSVWSGAAEAKVTIGGCGN